MSATPICATIKIPSPLRRFTAGEAQLSLQAATVADALEQLCRQYPELRLQLLEPSGGLRSFVNLYLDKEDIRSLQGLATPLSVNSQIRIVPAIAGGASVESQAEPPPALPELNAQEMGRYSRHLMLPELGKAGQQKLKQARMLVVGAGGLGSPLCLYLAAAGVGTLGIVDPDSVEESNLQRQVLFGVSDLGAFKAERAAKRLRDLNPHIDIHSHRQALTADNALALIGDYDLVIDGTDNFPTRYLVNDACVMLGKPNIYGSIFRFDGQATLFSYQDGPCYRCLYPQPPPPGLVPSCAEGGVLGVLPALIGSIQATEAIKLATGIGTTLKGRLLLYDALQMQFDELRIQRDPHCCLCGEQPSQTQLVDYQQFCGIAAPEPHPFDEISVEQLQQRLAGPEPPLLVDVREAFEVEICRIPGARHVPVQQVEQHLHQWDRQAELVVHCKSGVRSAKVCALLLEHGFRRPLNLSGGVLAWVERIDPSQQRY